MSRNCNWGIVAALFAAAHVGVAAQSLPPRDSDVKAAYLFNFGRFTTWPAGTGDADGFEVCVLGHDPMGAALDAIVAGEEIDGKRVTIRRLAKVEEGATCRIVFVSAADDANVAHILRALDGSRALTVGDVPRFVDRGGMIQFVNDGKRIRFTVNVSAAAQAGLTFSSELLRVAVAVRPAMKPGA